MRALPVLLFALAIAALLAADVVTFASWGT